MASASINLGLSREACEGAWRPPSLCTGRFFCPTASTENPFWRRGFAGPLVLLLLYMTMVGLGAEPMYGGKGLGDWLNSGHEDACQAVHEVGTPALPFILNKLASEDPRFGSNSRYARFYLRLPVTFRRFVPRPGPTNFDESRACSLLVELGPAAIPLLAETLRGTNPAVREVSAHVLGLMGERGKNIQVATSGLRAASLDACPEVATRCRWALAVASGHE